MLFNNSPVKNVSEKLKSPQTSIKNIKFERKKDFKSFLSYIEREAKALDAIKLPRRNEIQKKKGSGLGAVLGFGALGLLGLFGGAGSDSKRNDYKYVNESGKSGIDLGPVGRRKEGESDSDSSDIKKDSPITPTDVKTFSKNNLGFISDITTALRGNAAFAASEKKITVEQNKEINQEVKKEVKKEASRSRGNKRYGEKQVGEDSINKTKTATGTKSKGGRNKKYGPGKKTPPQSGFYSSPTNDFLKFINLAKEDYNNLTGKQKEELKKIYDEHKLNQSQNLGKFKSPKEFSDKTGQIQVPRTKVEFIGDDVFFDTGKGKIKLDVLTFKGKEYYFIDARASSFIQNAKRADKIRQLILFDDRFTVDDTTGKITYNPSKINNAKQEKINRAKKDVKSGKGLFQKKKRGSGLFSKLPFASTLSKSLSKPAFGTEPIKLLKAIRKSGLIKGVKTYAPGKLKTVLFGVDLALTGSAEMDSISKISLRNNIVTALFDLLGPSSTVNRMAEIFNQPGLLIPKVYQGQEGTYIYRDNKIINENIRKIKESNKKDFTRSDIYKGVTGNAEILNRIMHGKKEVPKIETIPKIRSIDKYDFSDDDYSGVNIFSDLQELKGRK